jgi:ankyrin repeat protein
MGDDLRDLTRSLLKDIVQSRNSNDDHDTNSDSDSDKPLWHKIVSSGPDALDFLEFKLQKAAQTQPNGLKTVPDIDVLFKKHTALHVAIVHRNFPMCKLLLQYGASPTNAAAPKCKDGQHAKTSHLAIASCGNEVAIVRLLLSKMADDAERLAQVRQVCGKHLRTALHVACGRPENTAIIAFLVKNGADIEARNSRNHTPLIHAVYAGNWAAITLLIHLGADINAVGGDKDRTALHFAVQEDFRLAVHALMALGARTDIADSAGVLAVDVKKTGRTQESNVDGTHTANVILRMHVELGDDAALSLETPTISDVSGDAIANNRLVTAAGVDGGAWADSVLL